MTALLPEQNPFQAEHNKVRFHVRRQLGRKSKPTTTLKVVMWRSFSLLPLLCGRAVHNVLLLRCFRGFFPPFFSWATIQKWLSNWSTDCIQSVSQRSTHRCQCAGTAPHPAASLHPSTQPRCWASPCSMSCRGNRLTQFPPYLAFPWDSVISVRAGPVCPGSLGSSVYQNNSQCLWIIYSNSHELAFPFLFCPVTTVRAAPRVSWRDRWHRGWSRARWL